MTGNSHEPSDPFEAELHHLPQDWAQQFRAARARHQATDADWPERNRHRLEHHRRKGLDVAYDQPDQEEVSKD